MIVYKGGDIFTTDAQIIVHGCNAQGKMGSGIALQIRDKYPIAYDFYKDTYEEKGLEVGSILMVNAGDKIIANAITQEYYGYNKHRIYAYSEDIEKCMKVLAHNLRGHTGVKIAMPKIGCGLGGNNWENVSKIIEKELKDFEVEVWAL